MRHFLFCAFALLVIGTQAQTRLAGTILGEGDKPLDGVNLVIGNDQHFGAVTDASGRFDVGGMRAGAIRLRATFVGYQPLDTALVLADGTNDVQLRMKLHVVLMREAEISGVRSDDRAPFAQSTLTKDELDRTNTGVDLPILLDLQPSVVTTT
ncbi:MAG: carboxypeptidase-like regulatory domain-containing protein, partial [Bacteroidota bacterium]|nr:carboxypeptidase-like regulatory domain-containing protein [Bacteroidota bacterium]